MDLTEFGIGYERRERHRVDIYSINEHGFATRIQFSDCVSLFDQKLIGREKVFLQSVPRGGATVHRLKDRFGIKKARVRGKELHVEDSVATKMDESMHVEQRKGVVIHDFIDNVDRLIVVGSNTGDSKIWEFEIKYPNGT